MTEELQQLLKSLGLGRITEIFPEQLKQAQAEDITYDQFLLRLLRPQWHARQENALSWRVRRAKMPELWTLETFPYTKQPGVNRRQIRLLLKAIQNGHRGQFVRAQDLFDDMYASLADRSSPQLIRRLARLDLLVIDELGYLNIRPEQANVFFKLMQERYRRKATIITTNLPYEEWASFLGNRMMTEALLGRVRHQCTTVNIEGPSLREPQGQGAVKR